MTLEISGVPHHSAAPRYVALLLAAAIVVVAAWSSRPRGQDEAEDAAERKRLMSKRDRLLNDLVRLEHDRQSGRVDPHRSAARREELMAALERIYGALDSDDADPAPVDRAGLAVPMGELRAS
jgi:FtsZ-interacting cell division protein ZipA